MNQLDIMQNITLIQKINYIMLDKMNKKLLGY